MKFIYELLRCFGLLTGYPLYAIAFRRKVYYEDRAVQSRRLKGGALIISNHYSALDFVYNIFLFPLRKLHVLFADAGWASRAGMKFFGGIPVDRSSIRMPFIDTSVDLLKSGKIVQIYPEAHTTKD
jgi:1-acyl-sn-glycerol-3-phosphate acyltransferase